MKKIYTKAKQYFTFLADFGAFKKKSLQGEKRFPLRWSDRFPCLKDRTAGTDFDRHYIYHTAWAARKLSLIRPAYHVDISSSLYFCSIVSAFIPVKFYDYRPAALRLTGLTAESADLLSLPLDTGSIQSLSCMHVVEHVGLGRYGDPLDPDGDLKAISELKRVLSVGGSLLFVVPIGKPKVMFNAHRIYAFDQIAKYFSDLELKAFALIPDKPVEGGLIEQATKEMADAQHYGCGCFWFKKV